MIYVTLFPCHKCALEIIGHGITRVLYLYDKNYDREKIMNTKRVFDLAGVTYGYYIFGNMDIFDVWILLYNRNSIYFPSGSSTEW